MAINEVPITIDYTSRDYEAIREELIARIKERIPEWNGADNSDFGVVLAEAFCISWRCGKLLHRPYC